MKSRSTMLRFAVSTATLAFAAAASFPAAAGDDGEKEQCAGVIKAGKNDCATPTNACHGHVTVDGNADAWIYLPKGTCEKLAGARVVKVTDPTPKK
jgi:uncharacterized membrane protein